MHRTPSLFLRVCLVGAFCTKFQRATSSFASSKLRCRSFIWHKIPPQNPLAGGVDGGRRNRRNRENKKYRRNKKSRKSHTSYFPCSSCSSCSSCSPCSPCDPCDPCNPCDPYSSLSVGSRGYAHKKAESSVCTVQPRTPPIELWRLRRAFYAFLIAATPGSSLPSINSSSAPPPVET